MKILTTMLVGSALAIGTFAVATDAQADIKWNGPGLVFQGTSPQGVAPTRQSEAAAANLHVTGIRLADGTELAVTAP